VISSISDRLGVSKSTVLDPTSSDAAIKQALAETHIIQETKIYFAANGVNLEAFKGRERSETAILIKNFVYGTTAQELKALFDPYGDIIRVLMPPSGTISIVEFFQPEHARSAFSNLAYRKFKDSILFLEKAPKMLFNVENVRTNETGIHQAKSEGTKPSTVELLDDEKTQATMNTSTLFVKNLNFSTTTSRLREVFQKLDGFASARVKMKPDPKKPGQFLSMGFGFLEFQSKQQAQAALCSMNSYKLDGHELLFRASHKALDAAEERRREDQARKKVGTKIIVKNLPFEATKKDVRTLFGSYGQLRSVRVPRKFDGSTRGFAFANFVTAREAYNAMTALKDTHLLGRRLVLDFAADDAVDPEKEIEKMQEKVGNQANKIAVQQLASVDRRKFTIEGSNEVERD
jgi:multiple RNA-binding domain-containing protein 1